MSFTSVTVSGSYELADGSPASGTVTFTPTAPMRNDDVVVAREVVAPITAGAMEVALAATDDADTLPVGAQYRVDERIEGAGLAKPVRRVYWLTAVPSASPTLDLASAEITEAYASAIVQVGPAGPTGPTGPAGATGGAGPTGPAGATGAMAPGRAVAFLMILGG